MGDRGRTRAERAWLTAGAVLVLLVAVAGWFLVVSPELGRAAAKHDATDAARTQNLALARHVDQLRANSSKLAELRAELSAAYSALPGTPSVEEFTRQLSAAARSAGVSLTSITATPPEPIGARSPAASSSGSSGDGAATDGQTYSIAVTVVSSGSTAGVQRFVRLVRDGPRAVLVTSAALAPAPADGPGSGGQAATLTLGLRLFTQTQSEQDRAELQRLLGSAPAK